MMSLANNWGGRNLGLVLLCLVTSSGCTRQQPPSPTGLSMTNVGGGSLVFYRWDEGPAAVMICSDIQAGASSEGERLSGPPPVRKEIGFISSPDGRRFDWQLETSDGRSVNCQLDGKEYDLTKGTLFLVTTKGGKATVEQLSRDLSAVQPEVESCKGFARMDTAVSKFLGTGAN